MRSTGGLAVLLPDMSGIELARQLRKSHPGCGVVFASGRPVELPSNLGEATFVMKPFGAGDLDRGISAAPNQRPVS